MLSWVTDASLTLSMTVQTGGIGYPIIGWCDLFMEVPRNAMASYEYLDNAIVFGMTLMRR